MINLGSIYWNLFAHVHFATDTIRDPFSPCLTKIPAGSVGSKEGLCCQRLMLQDVLAIVLLSSNLPQGIKKKKKSAISNHWNSHYGTLIVFWNYVYPQDTISNNNNKKPNNSQSPQITDYHQAIKIYTVLKRRNIQNFWHTLITIIVKAICKITFGRNYILKCGKCVWEWDYG